jgi:hypothetical protein
MKRYFIIFLLFTACSSRQKRVEQFVPYDAIEVKASGGFAGTTTGFLIQKNAEIYVIYHTAGKAYNQKFYRMSTTDSVALLFQKVYSSGILNKPYKKPGNLTYSILSRKDSTTNAVYWSDGQDSISGYIENYRMLRKFAFGQ